MKKQLLISFIKSNMGKGSGSMADIYVSGSGSQIKRLL